MAVRPNKYYFTGKPCKRGHIAKRFVTSRSCVDCSYEKNRTEQHRKSTKLYYSKNSKRMNGYAIEWAKKNPKKVREISRRHAKSHAAQYAAKAMKRYTAKLKRTPKWANLKLIEKFYIEAERLTKETGIQHQVDHIIPLQGEIVSGLHVEINLRVIPKIDNLKKGNSFAY